MAAQNIQIHSSRASDSAYSLIWSEVTKEAIETGQVLLTFEKSFEIPNTVFSDFVTRLEKDLELSVVEKSFNSLDLSTFYKILLSDKNRLCTIIKLSLNYEVNTISVSLVTRKEEIFKKLKVFLDSFSKTIVGSKKINNAYIIAERYGDKAL